jgi:hypothetical protein
MNPPSAEMPQFNLPPPPGEQASSASGIAEKAPRKPEKAASGAERAPRPAAAQPTTSLPAAPPPQTPIASSQSDDVSTTKTTKKPLLEDTDLIEKEWVNKAKHIVENTHNDPHKQSEELTIVKADYMKQHYGKIIKLSE